MLLEAAVTSVNPVYLSWLAHRVSDSALCEAILSSEVAGEYVNYGSFSCFAGVIERPPFWDFVIGAFQEH